MNLQALLCAFLVTTIPLTAAPTATISGCGADPTGRADSTQAFAKCLALMPSGNIAIPNGTYKISGTIVKNRNQNMIGEGSKSTVLQCQSTTAPCLVVADTSGGINNYNNSSLQDLTLQGPGTANTSIGLYLGGDPTGQLSSKDAYADGAGLINVRVTGFNRGIVWGNNSWGNKIVRSLIFGNARGLYVPAGLGNSGENIGLTDTIVFNNKDFGLDDHGNFEWMISGSAFDYNGVAIQFLGSSLHLINSHIEQARAEVIKQPYGSGDLSIRDSTILIHETTGSDKYILSLWPQNLQIIIDNVSVYSGHAVEYFLHASGAVSGTIDGLYGNGNKMIQAFSDPPNVIGRKIIGLFPSDH